MHLWPHSVASEICPITAQLAHLHRRLAQQTRLSATVDPGGLAIYVHALATEDVIVQVLLRRTQPLMLEDLPRLRHGASWQTDPEAVRHYARVTCTATRTYLARIDLEGEGSPPGALRNRSGTLYVFGLMRLLLIPALERASRDIADLSANRSTGGSRIQSRGGRECAHIVPSSTLNDASVSPLPLGNRQAAYRRRSRAGS
jgi:hypothetical protein